MHKRYLIAGGGCDETLDLSLRYLLWRYAEVVFPLGKSEREIRSFEVSRENYVGIPENFFYICQKKMR